METSQSIAEITKALCKAKLSFKPILKTSTNPFFKSKYAPLENVFDATNKALSDNGIVLTQFDEYRDGRVAVTTMLSHVSGEWVRGTTELTPVKGTPQDYGSAFTYARRYSAESILGVATEDDDDGNEASKPQEKKEEKKTQKVATRTFTELEKEMNNLTSMQGLTYWWKQNADKFASEEDASKLTAIAKELKQKWTSKEDK